jgi:CBS domain-containing protein
MTRKSIEARKVREVMTRRPICVGPDMSVAELKTMFEAHDVNMFPVVDAQGVLRGLVTKLDFLRMFRLQLGRWIPDLRTLWAEHVEDIMSRGLITVGPDESIVAAVDLMLESRLRSLPVVERHPEGPVVIGIVSRADLAPHLAIECTEEA